MTSAFVKRLVPERGFGFLTDASGTDVFFHRSGILNNAFDNLKEDDEVTFDSVESPKGPRAENVQLVSATATASA